MIVVSARVVRENLTIVLSAALSGQSIILTSRLGNFKISPINDNDTIVEKHLRTACAEVKAHMHGDMELPLAKDVVF